MPNHSYDLGFDRIDSFIKEYSPKLILLQLPDGLKFLAQEIIDYIRSRGVDVVLSGSHAYGACDLAVDEAFVVGADSIIHIGHNEYFYRGYSVDIPVLYIPAYYLDGIPSDLLEELVSIIERGGWSSVVLLASIQYVKLLDVVRERLVDRGVKAYIPSSSSKYFIAGQVIGCNYSVVDNISSDAYIILSSGFFHALGLCLYKPFSRVILMDIGRGEVIDMEGLCRRVLAKRLYIVSKLLNNPPRRVALVNGVRPGQYRPYLEKLFKEMFIDRGISVYTVSTTYLHFDEIAAIDHALKCDAYVVLSCPRIPVDDLADFHKPLLTPGEALMFLNNSLEYKYPW